VQDQGQKRGNEGKKPSLLRVTRKPKKRHIRRGGRANKKKNFLKKLTLQRKGGGGPKTYHPGEVGKKKNYKRGGLSNRGGHQKKACNGRENTGSKKGTR